MKSNGNVHCWGNNDWGQASDWVSNSTTTTTTSTSTSTSTSTTVIQNCPLNGDTPPCGTVSLSEVVTGISNWSAGNMTLTEVIALINAWAAS